jgi:uncharacterized membrane protein YeiB
MKKSLIVIGAMILLFIGQLVLINVDEKTYLELTRLHGETAEKELLAKGLTREQAASVISIVTTETEDAMFHAQSTARSVGLGSFMMAMLVFIYASREKS